MVEEKDSEKGPRGEKKRTVGAPKEDSIPDPQLMEYPVTFWRKIWKKIKSSME